jgi:hypothetical protein
MSAPIDMVLSRLAPFKLRENGSDRWRCCPAHGGSNPSALSVGVGDNGAVLLKCWHGCSADKVAGSLGLELADLFPPRESHGAPPTMPIELPCWPSAPSGPLRRRQTCSRTSSSWPSSTKPSTEARRHDRPFRHRPPLHTPGLPALHAGMAVRTAPR